MINVRLYTESGTYVCDSVIAAYNPLPEIVLWGMRVFKFRIQHQTHAEYIECFYTSLIDVDYIQSHEKAV